MTKDEALESGYCKRCAAFTQGGLQLCGVVAADKNACQLPEDVRRRWSAEMDQEHMVERKVKFGRGK